MTQLLFKNDIDQSKIDILLHLIKSWGIEAEVMPAALPKSKRKKSEPLTPTVGMRDGRDLAQDPFAGMRGMWEGCDIDDRKLREKAWGTAKRVKSNALPSTITSLFPSTASS